MIDALTPALLARHADARIPRYTSYPTAPHFSAQVGEADYREWLAQLPSTEASLYVHVPFCRAMCWYCGCHTTVSRREAPVERYLDALHLEIRRVSECAARPLTIEHLHLGGGTPTVMSPEHMRALLASLREAFEFSVNAEIAIEIDPRVLSSEMASTLGSCGFNRASLGVQSFDARVQQAINRIQNFDQTEDAVAELRRNGINRINFDLIYGLPHQTLRSCIDTVEQALKLRPDRLAVFGYAHVPSFKPHQRKIDATVLPGSDDRFTQSRSIAESLVRAGYVEIGLDHFALPEDPLALAAANGRLHRNFQGYTTDAAAVLIGLGASAIGRMPGGYVQNEVRIPRYEQMVFEGRLPIARGYRFDADDCLRGAVIERLMCDNRVDLAHICREFGTDPERLLNSAKLESLISDGLIERDGVAISVKPHARPLVRAVAAAFDAYLATDSNLHSRAV